MNDKIRFPTKTTTNGYYYIADEVNEVLTKIRTKIEKKKRESRKAKKGEEFPNYELFHFCKEILEMLQTK